MAMFVGLDVSLKTTAICIVEADGSLVWEGKAESEPASLFKVLPQWRAAIALVGILGLTPRVFQSGEIDRSGHISKCGDHLMRHALFEAANSHLRRSRTGQRYAPGA
jgi:transposase